MNSIYMVFGIGYEDRPVEMHTSLTKAEAQEWVKMYKEYCSNCANKRMRNGIMKIVKISTSNNDKQLYISL